MCYADATPSTKRNSCFNYFSKFNFSFERRFSKISKSKTQLYKSDSALDILAQNIKNEGSYVSDQLLGSKSLDVHRYRSQSLNISNQNPLIGSLKGSTGVKIASISTEKSPLPATVHIWQCGQFGVGTFHLFEVEEINKWFELCCCLFYYRKFQENVTIASFWCFWIQFLAQDFVSIICCSVFDRDMIRTEIDTNFEVIVVTIDLFQ